MSVLATRRSGYSRPMRWIRRLLFTILTLAIVVAGTLTYLVQRSFPTTEGTFESFWAGDVLRGRNAAVGGDYVLGHGWPALTGLARSGDLRGVLRHSSGRAHDLRPSECGFAYRDSLFKRDGAGRWLIVRVRFALPKAWTPRLDNPDLRDHPGLRVE